MTTKVKTKAKIYTDGAAVNGVGGYGVVIEFLKRGKTCRKELSKSYQNTTNNRMELMGVIAGLEALPEPCDVEVYSDSKYVVDAFNQDWIVGWLRRGWRRWNGDPVKNQDLWQRLLEAADDHEVQFFWVKGHNGHPQNERCDMLAKKARLEAKQNQVRRR